MEALEIKADQIPKLKFSRRDVLSTSGSRTNRVLVLKSAAIKSKLGKMDFRIHFKSKKRGRFVTSTCSVIYEDKYIKLDSGEKIPTSSIYNLTHL